MTAFSNVVTRLLNGLVTNATISTSGPKVTSFDFYQFYFGCAAEDSSGVSVVVGCTVQAVGYRGTTVSGVQDFTAVPGSLENNVMVKAKLGSGFTRLTDVTLAVIVSNATPLLTVMPFDDVSVDVYISK